MCDIVRWWVTRNSTSAPSPGGRPIRATSSWISGMPFATWPCPRALPTSCSSMPSMRSSGFSTSLSTCAAPSDSADWPGASGARRARVAIDQMQLAVEEYEPVGQRLLPLAPAGRAAPRQRLLTARDQPARHAVDRPRVQVVVAHEALDAERGLVVLVAEVRRD